jgi:hypothetical protein
MVTRALPWSEGTAAIVGRGERYTKYLAGSELLMSRLTGASALACQPGQLSVVKLADHEIAAAVESLAAAVARAG